MLIYYKDESGLDGAIYSKKYESGLDGVAGPEDTLSLQFQLLAFVDEEGVVERRGGRDAQLGVFAQHLRDEVSAGFVQAGEVLVGEVDLALGVLLDDLPHLAALEQRLLE